MIIPNITRSNPSAFVMSAFGIDPLAYDVSSSRFSKNTSSLLDDSMFKFSEFFENRTNTYYGRPDDENTIRALQKINQIIDDDLISLMSSIEVIRSSNLNQQRFIMAYPDLRKLYHQNKCDGYSDTYVDREPGKVGLDHYDYRRVIDGVVQYNEKDGVYEWTKIIEELYSIKDKLSFGDQVNILNTWKYVKYFMDEGEDPTDIMGGSL